MRRFDYSSLDNGLLSGNLTSIIYSLKTGAEIRKDEYEKIFTELEKIAKMQIIGSGRNARYVKKYFYYQKSFFIEFTK